MNGIIRKDNRRRGMYPIEIDGYGYTIIELLAAIELAVGDELRGPLDEVGQVELVHVRTNQAFEAVIQNKWVPKDLVDRQLLLP